MAVVSHRPRPRRQSFVVPPSSGLMLLLSLGGASLCSLSVVCSAQEMLTAQSLYQGMQDGLYDAVIDVRSQVEWDAGHIENATLVADMLSTASRNESIPSILDGCQEECTLVVTCRSGARAAEAILLLQSLYNFTGTLYNGRGTTQWTMAGYELVNTESVVPPCNSNAANPGQVCGRQSQPGEEAPSTGPRYSLTAAPGTGTGTEAPSSSSSSAMPSDMPSLAPSSAPSTSTPTATPSLRPPSTLSFSLSAPPVAATTATTTSPSSSSQEVVQLLPPTSAVVQVLPGATASAVQEQDPSKTGAASSAQKSLSSSAGAGMSTTTTVCYWMSSLLLFLLAVF